MAGGKETPRQKMIGMMYLVLTAMLALQVSSTLLEKFQLLNNSLTSSSNLANGINQKTLDGIQKAVKDNGSRADQVTIVNQAKDVREIAAKMNSEIEGIKDALIETAGGGPKDPANPAIGVKNPNEEDKVAIMMIGATKGGKAYELKKMLNDYVGKVNNYLPANLKQQPLGLDGREDPTTSKNPEQSNKDFGEINFAHTPVPAALALLSQKQSEVRRIEGEALKYLASRVGAEDIKFDKILAMISAESNVIVAGTKFKGEMFIAASSSSLTPRMTLNGSSLPVSDGKGKIEFTAQGGAYNSAGLADKTLSGSITFPKPGGRDTTINLKYEYKVAKPTYSIDAGSIPPLYLSCENILNFQSPQLGALWSPSFSGSGADFLPGGQKGKVVIVPNNKTVSMNVVNMGNIMGTETLPVRKVPRPRLEYYINGQLADEKRGVSASMARSIDIRAIADESFSSVAPRDANFRVSEAIIYLARGSRPVGQPVSMNGPNASLVRLAQQAQAGDRLLIEVKGVQRKNFRGNISETGVTDLKNIPLN